MSKQTKFKCYICGKKLTREEVVEVFEKRNDLDEREETEEVQKILPHGINNTLTDYYGLVHCVAEDCKFIDENDEELVKEVGDDNRGACILCMGCVDEAIEHGTTLYD